MTYSEKLKDPRWQKKRLEILKRDDFTCQWCGDKANTLHVHHLEYHKGRDPWNYDDDCLITLCVNCHECEADDYRGEKSLFCFAPYDEYLQVAIYHRIGALTPRQKFLVGKHLLDIVEKVLISGIADGRFWK